MAILFKVLSAMERDPQDIEEEADDTPELVEPQEPLEPEPSPAVNVIT